MKRCNKDKDRGSFLLRACRSVSLAPVMLKLQSCLNGRLLWETHHMIYVIERRDKHSANENNHHDQKYSI